MITTTLNRIRAHSPCREGWGKLLSGLGKTKADDEPLPFATILRINGLDDALWCMRAEPQYWREWRLYAVRRARSAQHMMTDPRSIVAIDTAERHANGQATDEELSAASAAAKAAARDARAAAKAASAAAMDAWEAASAANAAVSAARNAWAAASAAKAAASAARNAWAAASAAKAAAKAAASAANAAAIAAWAAAWAASADSAAAWAADSAASAAAWAAARDAANADFLEMVGAEA